MTLWLYLVGAWALGQEGVRTQAASLTVRVAAGDIATIEAWKTGGAFRLVVREVSGGEVASASWRDPPVTTLTWVATREGSYTVECEPGPGTLAECELARVNSRGSEVEVRRQRPSVEAALRDGFASLREWSPAGRKRAERAFGEALERTRALGLIDLEVDALLGLAEALNVAGKGTAAFGILESAVARARDMGDSRRLVLASARRAYLSGDLGQAGGPETELEQAMAVALEQDFPLGIATAHLSRGEVLYARSELTAAVREFGQALAAFLRLDNVEGAVESHLGLGYALADLNQDAQAKAHFEQARDLARSNSDRQREAIALRLLGNVFAKMTQEIDAIRCLEAAQVLFEQADDRASLVTLYNSLGELHGRLNDLTIAMQYQQKAATLAQAMGLRHPEGAALLTLAKHQQQLERLEEAASSYASARSLFQSVGDPIMSARALAGLGSVAAAQGRPELGIRHLQDALRTMRASGEARLSAGMLADIAEIQLGLGRASPAREAAAEALRLAGEAGDPMREARSCYLLAGAARMDGMLDEAQRLAERSLDIGEDVRARVPGHELRALFLDELDARYRFYVDLLMEQERVRPEAPFERLALAASERGRARALLDQFRQPVPAGPPADALRAERERALREEIRQRALDEDLAESEVHAADRAALAERLAERRRAQGVEGFTPLAAASFDVARVDGFRERLADQGTLLVEISLGKERSYLWALSRDGFAVHTLPARETLENQARELYALLTERQRDAAGSPRERRARAEAQDALFQEKGAALSRAVLGPIADLDGFGRLVVVSDGLLNHVPFSALPHPRTTPGSEYRPLVLSHEVIRVPSLAALAAIAERAAGRHESERPSDRGSRPRLAILADPVFTMDDPRVKGRGHDEPAQADRGRASLGERPAAESGLAVSLRGAGRNLASLPRLLASRDEAASIARVAQGTDVTVATGFQVDRAMAERTLADAYQVVHLATHGILNDEHPLLSGIVTSLVDEEGRRQDGFLRTQDVYDSRVGAQLVVLSACETALGRVLRGEGVTGLVQALMHAGADSVVASNWRVEDAATQELMTSFYRGLLVDGTSVATALRAAQLGLMQGKATRAPFFWAAFEAHGLALRFAVQHE